MSKCSLRIEMDKEQYRGGQTISGKVFVTVNRDVRCDQLLLTLGWRVHGRGNRFNEIDQEATLFKGQWHGGQSVVYPFEMTLPNEPATWHGNILNVDWYIRARADIPWAIDPKAEVDFIVERGDEPQRQPQAHQSQANRPQIDPRLQSVATVFPIIIALVGPAMGMLFICGGLVATVIGMPQFSLCSLFGLVFVVFGGWSARKHIGNLLSRRRVGDVTLSVTPAVAVLGEPIQVTLSMTARKDITIQEAKIALILRESATSGSGTNQRTHTHNHLMEEEVILLGHNLRKDQPFSTEITLTIPADATASLSVIDNRLIWIVRADIDMPGWADRFEETILTVR